jgi:hypothetical protein
MVSPKALNRTGRRVIVKLAAKCLGPGPRRLQMVKLAHELADSDNFFEVFYAGRRRPEAEPASDASATQIRPRAA